MSALLGAIRLAALDARGISLIDPSPQAAWRNLTLLVPLLLTHAISDLLTLPDGVEATSYLLLSTAVSAVQMTGYLLIVSRILDATGREDRFPLLLSTYVWCSVVTTAVGVAGLLVALQTPTIVAGGLTLGLVLWNLYYSWFGVRTALACPGPIAAGLVALEILTVLATDALPLQLALAARG